MIRHSLILLPLLLSLGCESISQKASSKTILVDSFAAESAKSYRFFRIGPGPHTYGNKLLFEELRISLSSALEEAGFVEAPEGEHHVALIVLDYAQDTSAREVFGNPIRVTSTTIVLQAFDDLEMQSYAAEEGARSLNEIWRLNLSFADRELTDLRSLAPRMFLAAKDYFARSSGRQIELPLMPPSATRL